MMRLPDFKNEFSAIPINQDFSIDLEHFDKTKDNLAAFAKKKLTPVETTELRRELKTRVKYLNSVAKNIDSLKKRIYKDQDHYQRLEKKKNSLNSQLQKIERKLQDPKLSVRRQTELAKSKEKILANIKEIERGQSELTKNIRFKKETIFSFKKSWEKETNEYLRNLSHGMVRVVHDQTITEEKITKAHFKPFASLQEAQRKITKNLENIGPRIEDWDSKQANARLSQLKKEYNEIAGLNVYSKVFGELKTSKGDSAKTNESLHRLLEIQKEVNEIVSSQPSLSIQSKVHSLSHQLEGLIRDLQDAQRKRDRDELTLNQTPDSTPVSHRYMAVVLEGIKEHIEDNMPSRLGGLFGSKKFTPKQLDELAKEKENLREILKDETLNAKNRKTAQRLFETIYEFLPDDPFVIDLESPPSLDSTLLNPEAYRHRLEEMNGLVNEIREQAAALKAQGKGSQAEEIENLMRPPNFPSQLPTKTSEKANQNVLEKLHELSTALSTLDYEDREKIESQLKEPLFKAGGQAKKGVFNDLDTLFEDLKTKDIENEAL